VHIVENTSFQYHPDPQIRAQYEQVCQALGPAVTLDGAQFGSRARRLRHFWQSALPATVLQAAAAVVQRPPGLRVQDILDPGREARIAWASERAPWTVCNQPGEPLAALPTLVSRHASHAFCYPRGKGAIRIAGTNQWDEPNADERERALGLSTGATAAPGVSERQRRGALGGCIDADTLQTILAIGVAWGASPAQAGGQQTPNRGSHQAGGGPAAAGPSRECLTQQPQTGTPADSPPASPARGACGEGRDEARLITAPNPAAGPSWGQSAAPHHQTQQPGAPCASSSLASCVATAGSPSLSRGGCHPATSMSPPVRLTSLGRGTITGESGPADSIDYPGLLRLSVAATVADATAVPGSKGGDIWADPPTLHLLQHGAHLPGVNAAVRTRVTKRLRYYAWREGKLYFLMPDGAARLVPHPEERRALVRDAHARTGHFGARRTHALLLSSYWWHGLASDVRSELRRCDLCARARASFNSPTPHLRPLPICGLFYMWGCDLFGPLPPTPEGHRYVMVAIEHLSKHVELAPLPDKSSAATARAFAACVLGRFGAPAEVLTDRGSEWGGRFEELLQRCLIDHRHTSANHPQADGLAERAVGTCKRALRKMVEQGGTVASWAEHLPWLALGHNASPQKSTGFSPMHLLFARTPTVPPAVRERLQTPLGFDTPNMQELTALRLLQRARLVQRDTVTATQNLRVAQHRDTLRYAAVRSGDYQPRLRRFAPGDYVYVQQQDGPALQLPARPTIMRVKEAHPSGVLVLMGNDGGTVRLHCSRCAPCHLPNIDTPVDTTRTPVDASEPCQICSLPDDEAAMLICDACTRGYHLYCLTPASPSRP
jgi:hypothetical protein